MNFYEGRKIEVHTTCKECKRDIVWYFLFPQSASNKSYIVNVIVVDENVSKAKVEILEERENKIDVKVSFYCRLCDYLHEFTGTIYKENGKLQFRE